MRATADPALLFVLIGWASAVATSTDQSTGRTSDNTNEPRFWVHACCQEIILTLVLCVCVLRYRRVCRGPDWVPQPLPLCQPARLVPLWMQKWFPWQWLLPARWELLHWWAYTELKASLSLLEIPAPRPLCAHRLATIDLFLCSLLVSNYWRILKTVTALLPLQLSFIPGLSLVSYVIA